MALALWFQVKRFHGQAFFYTSELPQEIEFTVNVTVDGLGAGPLVVDFLVEGDEFGLEPHSFDGSVTIYEDGGVYVPTFNVYRKLGPVGNSKYIYPDLLRSDWQHHTLM
jgi:hypothetical protein